MFMLMASPCTSPTTRRTNVPRPRRAECIPQTQAVRTSRRARWGIAAKGHVGEGSLRVHVEGEEVVPVAAAEPAVVAAAVVAVVAAVDVAVVVAAVGVVEACDSSWNF